MYRSHPYDSTPKTKCNSFLKKFFSSSRKIVVYSYTSLYSLFVHIYFTILETPGNTTFWSSEHGSNTDFFKKYEQFVNSWSFGFFPIVKESQSFAPIFWLALTNCEFGPLRTLPGRWNFINFYINSIYYIYIIYSFFGTFFLKHTNLFLRYTHDLRPRALNILSIGYA